MENKGLKHLLLNNNKPTDMELWFRSFLVGIETRIEPNRPDSVFYDKNNETLFELYDNKNRDTPWFYVKYGKIWSVLRTKYGLNYDDTKVFIKNVVEDTLNIGEVTPIINHTFLRHLVEDTLNIGEVTPLLQESSNIVWWKTP